MAPARDGVTPPCRRLREVLDTPWAQNAERRNLTGSRCGPLPLLGSSGSQGPDGHRHATEFCSTAEFRVFHHALGRHRNGISPRLPGDARRIAANTGPSLPEWRDAARERVISCPPEVKRRVVVQATCDWARAVDIAADCRVIGADDDRSAWSWCWSSCPAVRPYGESDVNA